ncbi:UvrD-helicase domain-containing protein [Porticoccaceae bacterium]|nr:UvrD-helicase domain-containing protein [Porticoccaceae bacterium]
MNKVKTQPVELSDAKARLQALDPNHSFIVSAPAGSGKTGLITQRLLRLLNTVENPEEILCITFTRKAAAEMRQRIHSALVFADQNPRPKDLFEAQTWDLATNALARDKTLDWNLLDIPYRLRIKTIDSFCHYIAKQFMFDNGNGALPEQSEYPQALYHTAARELLKQIESNNATSDALSVVAAHMGNDLSRCEKLFANMLSKRDQWLPHIFTTANNSDYFQQVIEQVIVDTLEQIEQQIFPLAGELIELADYAGNNAAKENTNLYALKGIADYPPLNQQGLSQWKNILRLLVKKDKDFSPRKTVSVREGFPPSGPEEKARIKRLLAEYAIDTRLQSLVVDVMHLPELAISVDQQQMLNALGLLLPQLSAILKITFQQQGQSDYSEITMTALDALEPDSHTDVISDITLKLDYQLRHILVDEFQDTSGSQMRLLEHLVVGWEPEDGRTLFLVGDAMQSLYSFRDARVGLFINAQRYPIGPVQCHSLALTSNFRSKKGIVDWVNQNFVQAFPSIANINRGAVPYHPSTGVKEEEQSQAVYFHGYSCKETNGYNLAEAEHITKLCQQIRQDKPNQTIAILVRNRGHLKHIVPALIDANLSWEAIDIDPLADRMPVIDLMSLTRALLSPADRIAWLSVLRAPYCGLSLKDLVQLTNGHQIAGSQPQCILNSLIDWHQKPKNYENLTSEGSNILCRVAPILINAWDNRNTDNLRNLIEQLWIDLGGPATLINQRDIYDIRRYLDLLESWQQAGSIADWNEFTTAVDNLYAQPIKDVGNNSTPPIQIMTIHKAKGLEFDQVILPGLSKSPRSDDNPLLRWQEQVDEDNNSSLLLASLGPYDEDNDQIYSYLKHEQSARTILENTRVLYVAATRAVRQLHLFGKLNPTKDSWQKPAKNSLLACVWPSLKMLIDQTGYTVTPLDNSTQKDISDNLIGINYLRRLGSDFIPVSMPRDMMSLGVNTQYAINVKTESLDYRARHMGTALHRTLKQIASDGINHWPLERRNTLESLWLATLKQLGVLATNKELKQLRQSVETMLNDTRGQWILDAHDDGHCEQALSYFDNLSQSVKTSIIDRTFIDNQQRWIIDYKYSAVADNESEKSFIARQTEAYRPQLNHYAELYQKLESRKVRCALYFPQTSVFIEVTRN